MHTNVRLLWVYGKADTVTTVSGTPELPEETFDEFCERLNVTPDEYPHAFAAWLDRNYDWDGRYERVDEPGADAEPPPDP
jgi:hypothetical protein